MKYTCSVDIARPIDTVINLFDNPDNLKHWQPGLLSFEHLSGDPGTPGATSKLHYKMGKREIEMIETVIARDLPSNFSGTYEANGVKNIVRNEFIPIDENNTRYITHQEFQFSGFMKLMGWFMPGAFK
jgi:carbon monoxide dehydrogenase subunit G